MNNLHPEQRPDEIYMGNVKPGETVKFRWCSGRLGQNAYMTDGTLIAPVNGLFPWFIKVGEVETAIKKADPSTAAILQRMVAARRCGV